MTPNPMLDVTLPAPRFLVGLLQDLIGLHQDRLRDGEADLLGSSLVDHQLELRRLFDRDLRGRSTLQYPIDEASCLIPDLQQIGP